MVNCRANESLSFCSVIDNGVLPRESILKVKIIILICSLIPFLWSFCLPVSDFKW